MGKLVETSFLVVLLVTLLVFTMAISAQEFITLENERGVQKNSFLRGEGIVITVTLPQDSIVEVWLYNPPEAPGPSSILFISRTPIPANVQTKLGPKWLDEKAPCGKYQFEIRIFDLRGGFVKSEYRYFDYAMNEPPCAITPPPPPPPDNTLTMMIILGVAIAAVVIAVVAILMLRPGARPPKERAPIMPPVAPPSPPPSAPPKAPHRRRPIIRSEQQEEES